MPVQEFVLDAVGNSVQVFFSDESETVTVLFNRSIVGIIPTREELRAARAFALPDGSTLSVQLVETQLQVSRKGQRLSQNLSEVPPQMNASKTTQRIHQEPGPAQGNWLLSHIQNSKVAVSISENILCRIAIHQGEWTKTGCLQTRYCIFCAKPQNRESHNWSRREYSKEGSCEMRIRCYDCGKTKPRGKRHEKVELIHKEGSTNFYYCSRCTESWEIYESSGD